MQTFSKQAMTDEVAMVRQLVKEARAVPSEEWTDWASQNKDKIRFSGNDGYVPEQEEWIKRCEGFLASMGAMAIKNVSE
ncbi:MAG: hypothetical protein GY947_07435 [Rhodobacteraceae bacterium]|nr:hypothetical protein [Paracoccaceae bacterium]